MKKALPRSLKPEKREILKKITDLILEKVPNIQMIILFGSYTRGNYVEYDERKDFGVYTVFRSDFDLLILLDTEIKDGIKNKIHKAANACLNIKGNHTATELVALEVDTFNRYLSEG
ncbi:MAG: nucleotidyltransferase domain-containing protein [Bacteroidales bacterium]|nr:nucleotidyltransferase domain-containing protein [Bacteroidales bacterium]